MASYVVLTSYINTPIGSIRASFKGAKRGMSIVATIARRLQYFSGPEIVCAESSKMLRFFVVLCLLAALVFGCARKPNHIRRIESPIPGLFYTIESFDGGSTIDTTFTQVYAHLKRGNQSDMKLVLNGEYLTIEKIVWNSPYDATLCFRGGTNRYHNQVLLSVKESSVFSVAIHNHLKEHCGSDR
jgi:hypothetical protein